MYQRLLVPVDESEASERAMRASIALARQLGASITGLFAVPFMHASTSADAGQGHHVLWRDSHAQQHANDVLTLFERLPSTPTSRSSAMRRKARKSSP